MSFMKTVNFHLSENVSSKSTYSEGMIKELEIQDRLSYDKKVFINKGFKINSQVPTSLKTSR